MVGAVLAAGLLGAGALALRSGGPDSAEPLVRAADRFVPPPEWELIESTVRRSGSVCVDVACPSVSRRYAAAAAVPAGQVQASMARAGWSQVRVDGDCRPQPGRTGAFPLCRASATAGQAAVELVVAGPQAGPPGAYGITLTLSG